MTTVGTVAACGFGGVLIRILTSDNVMGLITKVSAATASAAAAGRGA